MTVVDAESLRQLAVSGDAAAQMALAGAFDAEGRHDIALQWLQRAADGGYLPALTQLGARLLTGRAAPQMPSQGAQMLNIAADAGDARACAILAVLNATGQTRPQSWSAALDCLFRAAQAGDLRSRDQIAMLVRDPALMRRIVDGADDRALAEARGAIDLAAWLRPPAARPLCAAPRIAAIEGFLPAAACEWIVEMARPRLDSFRLAGQAHPGRNNVSSGFSLLETDFLMQLVNARIAAASGLPFMHQEATNVLNYAVGEEYLPHYDFIDPEEDPLFAEKTRLHGQRAVSVLIYLNDDYEGGETDFPRAGVRFRGRVGDALLYQNLDAQGAVDRQTLHAGLPTTRGEKWLLSKWIRDRAVPQF